MLGDRIRTYLEEDGADWRDVNNAIVAGHEAGARVVTREPGTVAGVDEALAVFAELGPSARPLVDDGDGVDSGDRLLEVEGDAAALLRGERLALNLLGSMSGIATMTRRCVEQVPEGVRVTCTRKTTPGYRYFEKKAVLVGGGDPQRFDLADSVLLKENHFAILGMETAIERARRRGSFSTTVSAEAESLAEAERAVAAGVDIVLLDNMSPRELESVVDALGDENVILEASGGITPESVADYAATGVDVVGMGSLTHSSNWLDLSMLVDDG